MFEMQLLNIFALLLTIVMTDEPNAFISNGTCYYAVNKQSPSNFIPCGNVAFGHTWCCQAGDNCESSRACFNYEFKTTYLAGCTDPEYADPSCPNKDEWSENIWAGLVPWNNGPEWVACNDTASTIKSGDPCPTTVSSPTIAFTDAPTLSFEAKLPTSLGGEVLWQGTYSPNSIPTATTAATSTTGSFSASTASSTSASSATSSQSSMSQASTISTPASTSTPTTGTLTAGTKAGIGVGAAAGVLLLGALIWALLICMRRRRKYKSVPPVEDQIRRRSTLDDLSGSPEKRATFGGEDDPRSPTFSGHKSELSAEGIGSGLVSPASTHGEFNNGRDRTSGISNASPQRCYRQPPLPHGVHELPLNPPRQGFHEMPA